MVPLPPLRIKLRSRGSTNDEASSSTATARSTGKKVHWRTRRKLYHQKVNYDIADVNFIKTFYNNI